MFQILFVLLITLLPLTPVNGIGCRDENNNLVQWFYGYKLPSGLKYFYIIPNDGESDDWIESSRNLDDSTSLPGRTISQLYQEQKNNTTIVALMYNDEAPNGTTDATDGHTKGVVGGSVDGGFWLIHSVPHFPPTLEEGRYGYPKTGEKYGQSFLCITLNGNNLDLVGKQLLYNEPFIYSSKIPSLSVQHNLIDPFPYLRRAIQMEKIMTPPFWNREEFSTVNGEFSFTSFAKNRKFKMELYEDLVAPTLHTNLLVETWLNGPGKIHSECTNVQQ